MELSAKEAREICENEQAVELKLIFKDIMRDAQIGNHSTFSIVKRDSNKRKLTQLGYKLAFGGMPDLYKICWEK